MAAPFYIPPFDEMLQASASLGLWSNAPDLWRGCVGYWPLSEGGGGTAFDLARGNTGTWNGNGDHHAVGRLGRCGQFNGVDDSVDIPDTFGIFAGQQEWTISMYYRQVIIGQRHFLIGMVGEADLFLQTGEYQADNVLHLRASCDDAWSDYIIMPAHEDDRWYHAAITRNTTSIVGYQNGTVVDTNPIGSIDVRSDTNAIGSFELNKFWWNGLIANTIIHNRALTPSEILHLYERPHDMVTLRRPVTTVVMGGAAPPATSIPVFRHHYQQQGVA